MLVKSSQSTVASIPPIEVSPDAKKHLAEAIQFKTISNLDPSLIDSTEFAKLKSWISDTYPMVDSLLEKLIFEDYAHLYRWEGKNKDLAPVVLMGHMDVVPVPEENLPFWKQDPFGGVIADGDIWGRGAIDDKINVIGLLEATEMLLKKDFQPERTIYLAFGHDEEVSGKRGAKMIVDHLKSEGVRPDFVLDEGYTLTKGLVPGMDKQVALIGIAEKGYLTVRLSAEVEGGHSSMPGKETAIEVISQAIYRLEEHPFPERISYPVKAFFRNLGPEMPFVNKMAFGNFEVFKPLILSTYRSSNAGAALIQTTMVPTIFHSGVKDNVVPLKANVTFNFRLLPGDSMETVMAHLKKWVKDDRVSFQVLQYQAPSVVSDDNSWGYEQLDKSIKEVFPNTLTSPNLVIGGTDSRHFQEITNKIYRFAPYQLTPETLSMFHGLNERISVSDFDNAVRFYVRLMENLGD
ncbi:MAG: M20 family peptidase [Bacteroidia bacterium]|nr:M20 family peptidase [Bacteroidia bacterium]